jgi:hypothetical protein
MEAAIEVMYAQPPQGVKGPERILTYLDSCGDGTKHKI